jgi:RHS repeat-associated protein
VVWKAATPKPWRRPLGIAGAPLIPAIVITSLTRRHAVVRLHDQQRSPDERSDIRGTPPKSLAHYGCADTSPCGHDIPDFASLIRATCSIIAMLGPNSGALIKTGYAPDGRSSSFPAILSYTGQAADAEANDPYYGGRLMQVDPVGYGGGTNLYAYVHNDPLNLTDPLGLCDNPQGCGGNIQLAAAGDLRCQGFSGGCQSGGSFGTTAMYGVSGRNLCAACAVKILGIENEPASEKVIILRPFLLPGRKGVRIYGRPQSCTQ